MKYGFDLIHPEDLSRSNGSINLKSRLIEVMEMDEKYSIDDIMKLLPELENDEFTTQHLLDGLIKVNIISVYTDNKGRKYYAISDE